MKGLVFSVIAAYMFLIGSSQGQRCLPAMKIPSVKVSCRKGYGHGSDCTMSCERDNFSPNIGSIYCFRGVWHDYRRIRQEGRSDDTKVSLSQIRCEIDRMVDDVQGRSEGFGQRSATTNAPTCARMVCPQNYPGITKSKCEKVGCCWNAAARSCHTELCPEPRNYRGISKSFCEKGVKVGPPCKYNQGTMECYKVKVMATSCPKGTANPPNCQPITCPSLQQVANSASVDCTSGQSYGSTCTVRCAKGYGSTRSLSATCGGDGSSLTGTWTSMPTCTRLSCMAVTEIANGKIRCGQQNRAGSSCSIGCQDSYEINIRSIYCNGEDGKWYDFSRMQTEGITDSNRVDMGQLKCAASSQRRLTTEMAGSRSAVTQCSAARQKCHISYTGQTAHKCAQVGCCWNTETSSCQAQLCPSPRNFAGISKSYCESGERGRPSCKYNRQTTECVLDVQSAMQGTTQNVVKIPKVHQWEANLRDGSTKAGVDYQVTTSRGRAADATSTREERDIVSVIQPFRDDDSYWRRFRRGACHFAGVVKVDTTDKDEVTITLKYNNDWDLMNTFSMSNVKSTEPNNMLVSVFNPTSFVQIKFKQQPHRNIKEYRVPQTTRPNDILNSGLKTITLKLNREDSTLQYSVALRNKVKEGKFKVKNLFTDEEELYLYINRASNYVRRSSNNPKRGFGLCEVNVDAS